MVEFSPRLRLVTTVSGRGRVLLFRGRVLFSLLIMLLLLIFLVLLLASLMLFLISLPFWYHFVSVIVITGNSITVNNTNNTRTVTVIKIEKKDDSNYMF